MVEVLEPDNTSYKDTWIKAKGLAVFARDHGTLFGRLEMIKVETNGAIRRLNVNNPVLLRKVVTLTGEGGLEELYR